MEEDKPDDEKGKYLHPTEWGWPASSGIDYEEQQMQEMEKQGQQMQQTIRTQP